MRNKKLVKEKREFVNSRLASRYATMFILSLFAISIHITILLLNKLTVKSIVYIRTVNYETVGIFQESNGSIEINTILLL